MGIIEVSRRSPTTSWEAQGWQSKADTTTERGKKTRGRPVGAQPSDWKKWWKGNNDSETDPWQHSKSDSEQYGWTNNKSKSYKNQSGWHDTSDYGDKRQKSSQKWDRHSNWNGPSSSTGWQEPSSSTGWQEPSSLESRNTFVGIFQ